MAEFIFMLTHNDHTVPDAKLVLTSVCGLGLTNIGFKDKGSTPSSRKAVTNAAHDAGMRIFFEIVSTDLEDELAAVDSALDAGVDWILGTTHPHEVAKRVEGAAVTFAPFPGRIIGHPSELAGSLEEITADAVRMADLEGVGGLDLLAYRHRELDPVQLAGAVVNTTKKPIICAGSITTATQVRALEGVGVWGFTIGSAIFDGLLGGDPDIVSQVRTALAFA